MQSPDNYVIHYLLANNKFKSILILKCTREQWKLVQETSLGYMTAFTHVVSNANCTNQSW